MYEREKEEIERKFRLEHAAIQRELKEREDDLVQALLLEVDDRIRFIEAEVAVLDVAGPACPTFSMNKKCLRRYQRGQALVVQTENYGAFAGMILSICEQYIQFRSTVPGCGQHEWNIFGWCTDWRSLLLLAALLLALFLLICLLHCCCKLCIDPCQVKKKQCAVCFGHNKEKEEKPVKCRGVRDPPVQKPVALPKKYAEYFILSSRPNTAEWFPRDSCYDVEQSAAILPPPATVTQPVFVPIPVHGSKDSAAKKVEQEIKFVTPPKPDTVDVGVNTDPWPLQKKPKVKKVDNVDKVCAINISEPERKWRNQHKEAVAENIEI
ncbi:unnamed protein product [Strongylus vulgaris]|uniref:Uncharacterized protein n=1 Tax=Strongylus vulgaris TaxID=40348 RepID=A0A3P7JDE9_STRVU|nr:unnamed protein product [Strongylus vulgaris]